MLVSINLFFFFNDTATTEIYTLSLHDALPISSRRGRSLSRSPWLRRWRGRRAISRGRRTPGGCRGSRARRSEEHTSELQSPCNLVCRLLLEEIKISERLYSKFTVCTNTSQSSR